MADKLISANNVRNVDGSASSVMLYQNDDGVQYYVIEELEPAPKKEEETNE